MSRRLFRSVRWLAILAIALQALWPLLATAKPRSVVLVPVCTVAGETHYMELETGGRDASHEDHCKACPVGAVALASRVPPSFIALASSVPEATRSEAAEPRFTSYARPRAPPAAPHR